MSRSRSHALATARRAPTLGTPVRLDLLANPYGPSVHVGDALARADDLHLPAGERETRFHLRLARHLGVAPEWLTLANGMDELLGMVLLWRRERGPLVLFPPTDPTDERRARLHGLETVYLARSARFAPDLDATTVAELPRGATALVGSPNDPTGTLLGSQDAVRLARGCETVVVDERHTEYCARTLVPLAREFDSIVVLQTFETWAGLAGLPLAYAIAPPRLGAELARYRRPGGVTAAAVVAADATLDDLAYVRATVGRVREEKSRLYRTLRKLNVVSVPHASWANFLLARVERGDPETIVRELARREVIVHRPSQQGLERYLRVTATTPEGTTALKRALIEIAAALP